MHKELVSIKLIRDYLEQEEVLPNTISSIDDIYNFFQYLTDDINGNKFNSLYILNYIHQYIVTSDVAKRKTSARVFEDLLAILFNGEVADNKKRKNIQGEVPDYFQLTKDKIAGNKREKIDLLFEEDYGVSLKTLMIDNKEINLGSFEKKILFDGFNVTQFLTERKTDSTLGLGSIPRLRNLLTKIKEEGNYDAFANRFQHMFNFIFSDDMVFLIKDINHKAYLYFFSGKEFTSFISNRAGDIEELLSVVNRWEGNSIRIDRGLLLESCARKVELDLTKLKETVVKLVNELDYKLHKTYIDYFNVKNNQNLKEELLTELDNLFEEFDKNFSKLY